MIVEDDEMIRESMKLLLELEGYEVLLAGNGKQALDLLASGRRPNLILLDLMMPVMDGYEFLRARARDPELHRIPVIVVSAFLGESEPLDAQGFVAKPIDFDLLRPLLDKYGGGA
jgi:CheY-like chemotaxis protein